MKKYVVLSLLFSIGALSQDRPNYSYEERLNNTFLELKESKLSNDQWQVMTMERNIDQYTIVPGDNLWDVSKTIFGSGFFWPKLWQLNSSITNPHDIEPGFSLGFIDMGVDAPPVLQTEEGELTNVDAVVAETELEISEDEILELNWEEPELPQGAKKVRVLDQIPPSFFDWRTRVDAMTSASEASVVRAGIFDKKKYYIEYLFSQKPFKGEGEVVEMALGYTKTAATYDYIYIRVKAAGVGDEFVAMKNLEPIEDKEGEIVGYPVEVQGLLKIVETIDPDKDIHKALVLKSFRAIDLGVELSSAGLPASEWGIEGNYLDVKAEVVGGRFDPTRQVLALGSLIYLNKGSKDGISAGSLMNVLRHNRIGETKYSKMDSPSIGRLKIVHTDESVATAVIVESRAVIRPGDITGNPVSLQISQ